jgi:hypothetical protein
MECPGLPVYTIHYGLSRMHIQNRIIFVVVFTSFKDGNSTFTLSCLVLLIFVTVLYLALLTLALNACSDLEKTET